MTDRACESDTAGNGTLDRTGTEQRPASEKSAGSVHSVRISSNLETDRHAKAQSLRSFTGNLNDGSDGDAEPAVGLRCVAQSHFSIQERLSDAALRASRPVVEVIDGHAGADIHALARADCRVKDRKIHLPG